MWNNLNDTGESLLAIAIAIIIAVISGGILVWAMRLMWNLMGIW